MGLSSSIGSIGSLAKDLPGIGGSGGNTRTIVTAGGVPANITFSAGDVILGRDSTGAGSGQEIPCTAQARALLDDSTAADQRATLGLTIGSDVQAWGDVLDDLNTLGAALANDEFLVSTGAGVLAWESGATARGSLGFTNPILDKASPGNIGTGTPGSIAATTMSATGSVTCDTLACSATSGLVMQLGNLTGSSIATPLKMSLGGTSFNATPLTLAGLKFTLYEASGGSYNNAFGLGVSASRLEYHADMGNTSAYHSFYTGRSKVCEIGSAGITMSDAKDIAVDTTTGTKIGTSTAQKLSFWDATPVVQPSHIADATASHSITDPGDSPADADALRDDLVANTIPSIEAALDALGSKINTILANIVEATGLSATS